MRWVVVLVLAVGLGCVGSSSGPSPGPSPSRTLEAEVAPAGGRWKVTIRHWGGEWSQTMTTPSTLAVYSAWDAADRLWVYDSDTGSVYRFDPVGRGGWTRLDDPPCAGASPPLESLPDYARDRGWCTSD